MSQPTWHGVCSWICLSLSVCIGLWWRPIVPYFLRSPRLVFGRCLNTSASMRLRATSKERRESPVSPTLVPNLAMHMLLYEHEASRPQCRDACSFRQVHSVGCAFGLWCGGLCNRRWPCLVDYSGSHLARPTAPSHGGAVTFLGHPQAVAVSPRQFPCKRRMDQPDSKMPKGLLGASGCGARAGSAWLRHETPLGVEVLGRIRSGDVSMLYWEQRDGVHWACLEGSEGSNGDLVRLGLSSLTLAMLWVSSGHSRRRVAGI
jgi:hypothetical protein